MAGRLTPTILASSEVGPGESVTAIGWASIGRVLAITSVDGAGTHRLRVVDTTLEPPWRTESIGGHLNTSVGAGPVALRTAGGIVYFAADSGGNATLHGAYTAGPLGGIGVALTTPSLVAEAVYLPQ